MGSNVPGPRLASKLEVPTIHRKALALLGRMRGPGRPWVWKDPALCHFLPFWMPLWGDVVYVVTVRHPIDVARSWQRMAVPEHLQRDVDLTVCNLLRWQHMMLMVLHATGATNSKIFVEFERLMADPAREAQRLAAFLDQKLGGTSAADRVAGMARAVDPSHWRHRAGRPFDEAPQSTTAQRSLYRLLQAKVEDASTEFVDDLPMPAHWWSLVRDSEANVRNPT